MSKTSWFISIRTGLRNSETISLTTGYSEDSFVNGSTRTLDSYEGPERGQSSD